MSTYFPSGKELAGRRKWYVVDASGQTVGHLASEVASILTGKRSPQWIPFLDTVDHVVVMLDFGFEFHSEPSAAQVEQARAAIDAGATIVAGHHPHVLQPD